MGKKGDSPFVGSRMSRAAEQHLDWMARSLGGSEYAPLTSTEVDLIRDAGEVVSRQPGTHLFVEGDLPVAVYVLERGDVEVYRGSGTGKRVVAHASAGTVLGDLAVFGNEPYVFSVRVSTPVRVLRLARSRLLPELARHPAITMRWLVAGQKRLAETQRRVIALSHKTVLARVADLLVDDQSPDRHVALAQAAIANLLGVSRQSVNEALGRLRDQGLVTTGYRSIRLRDIPALERIAAG